MSPPDARWGMILSTFTYFKEPHECDVGHANTRQNFTFSETDKLWLHSTTTSYPRSTPLWQDWCNFEATRFALNKLCVTAVNELACGLLRDAGAYHEYCLRVYGFNWIIRKWSKYIDEAGQVHQLNVMALDKQGPSQSLSVDKDAHSSSQSPSLSLDKEAPLWLLIKKRQQHPCGTIGTQRVQFRGHLEQQQQQQWQRDHDTRETRIEEQLQALPGQINEMLDQKLEVERRRIRYRKFHMKPYAQYGLPAPRPSDEKTHILMAQFICDNGWFPLLDKSGVHAVRKDNQLSTFGTSVVRLGMVNIRKRGIPEDRGPAAGAAWSD
ncbi:hypothetical protein FN846DRAFT_903501 [Sphaerosporella brunnea]|uniref:Uncharacterized protein n=1 Tax=Sphaerosporella brunnea TaxID=1250544 RepID=A0A5J5F7S5_9PEZI|nr:hypothetical protein FN846DRAFT_903501 [Sphaerosporella brunnea]